ncbi:AcrR family transcriptional regulator [Agrobacterium vitis]|nr:AcrR family transcriptional regulator [Agrobacterium vitis]MBE1439432.1 AcrR family transcriptional regulator [Agrobacterium vitis]
MSKVSRGKADKLRRIRDASRAMFLTKGYEAATIREIARVAEVAQGTLFLYASSKRDLLFMLYNDVLQEITDSCETIPVGEVSILENLMQIALIHLQRYSDEIAIMRLSLVNLNLYDHSDESRRFEAIYTRVENLVGICLSTALDQAELRRDFAVDLVSNMIFVLLIELFKAYLRSDPPDIRRVMHTAHQQLCVVLNGLGATEKAFAIKDSRIIEFIS